MYIEKGYGTELDSYAIPKRASTVYGH